MAGGRKETVSDDEILSLFVETDDPVLTTSEVADVLDFSLNGTRKRLDSLEANGLLAVKRAGRGKIWWLTDEGREFIKNASENGE
ncbi:hypothetical protein [Haloarchaeobius iranensis]|uniref:Uncharacterized protein n=1 Tax=Haloarchaeobius iranensis TaxID=996166 RepID=A0A1G9YDQ1_9EURY|nr:hypothetical protein [Haloarchaeobius iranensis]SDN07318.1 hypothetical protein SAMN05192554_11417 [Haloarchaeobius iranensis]